MGRLIDADALMEYIGVERLDSRERIAELIQRQPTVEPCEDAINRQAALNELEHLRELSADGEMIEADDVLTTLTFLPSVQPQHWIPCSERLPEPRVAVLGYAPRYKNIFALYYDSMMGWMVWSPIRDDCFPNSQGEIVAWMPLPEPYQEGE